MFLSKFKFLARVVVVVVWLSCCLDDDDDNNHTKLTCTRILFPQNNAPRYTLINSLQHTAIGLPFATGDSELNDQNVNCFLILN